MRAVVVGTGAVGARAAEELTSLVRLEALALVDQAPGRARAVAKRLGPPARATTWSDDLVSPGDVAILASARSLGSLARAAVGRGAHVVSVADAPETVADLLTLDTEASERGRQVVVGAGFCPGLSCLLARHGAATLDVVDEIHVAKVGTGGPACASQHHRAMSGHSLEWRDRAWSRPRAGSGRSLCLFPEPLGYRDCYRARLGDPLVLVPAFSGVERVSARVAATRRDRLTAGLPMWWRPHPEERWGAVRVELRGWRGAARESCVLGAAGQPARVAGVVAALAAQWSVESLMSRPGAAGLAELVEEPVYFLRELTDRGVRAAVFEGSGATTP